MQREVKLLPSKYLQTDYIKESDTAARRTDWRAALTHDVELFRDMEPGCNYNRILSWT